MTRDEKVAERFRAATPVYDTIAEDEEELRDYEEAAAGVLWDDAVHRAGAELYGRPVLSRMDNPSYGRPLTDNNGEPILGEDGEQLTDVIKFYLIADGWAIRGVA